MISFGHILYFLLAFWAPDSRHIIVIADFSLRTTVYSLLSGGAHFLQGPKQTNAGLYFLLLSHMLIVECAFVRMLDVELYSCTLFQGLLFMEKLWQ